MGLPNVNIARSNNNLGRTVSTQDNVFAMLLSGAAVSGGINLNEAHLIQNSTTDVAALGITGVNNPLAYAEIVAFFAQAGEGADLYIMLYANTSLFATICDVSTGIIRNLIDEGQGRIRYVFVNKTLPGGYTISLTDGLDADVWDAVTKLQAVCEFYDADNQPLGAVLPGFGFLKANTAALRDLNTMTKEQVSILLGSDAVTGKPAIGALAGWMAKTTFVKNSGPINKYWQNIGIVSDGSVLDAAWFIDGTASADKTIKDALGLMHDRRYIFFRKFVNKSGFFFNDDPTATSVAGDYTSISWNRVINKAKLTAYNTLIEKLNSDVDPDPTTGGIAYSLASDWEADVERDIKAAMISKGAITAVKCTIDAAQSNLLTDQIAATIEIVRKGQAKTINVSIGFTTTV